MRVLVFQDVDPAEDPVDGLPEIHRFVFNKEDNSWSLENNGQEVKLFTFVDDTHIDVINRDGGYTRVELSEPGVLAYEQLVGYGGAAFALN